MPCCCSLSTHYMLARTRLPTPRKLNSAAIAAFLLDFPVTHMPRCLYSTLMLVPDAFRFNKLRL